MDKENTATAMVEELRARFGDKRYGTIKGSMSFQVVLFSPNSDTIKAAPRIILCESCRTEYGSCVLFQEYDIPVQHLKEPSLRSSAAATSTENSQRVLTNS